MLEQKEAFYATRPMAGADFAGKMTGSMHKLKLPLPDSHMPDDTVALLEAGVWGQARGAPIGLPDRVLYGSDQVLNLDKHWPGHEQHPFGQWRTSALPKCPQSLLSLLEEEIAGVTGGMSYLGSLGSFFAFHVENQRLPSYNLLMAGSPKVWYAVTPEHISTFRAACAAMRVEPNLATMIDLEKLAAHGVPLTRAVQRPGQVIITFPGAYHAGFNTGPNWAEAANFAFSDWLPHGRMARDEDGRITPTPLFAFDRLLLALAMHAAEPSSPWYADRAIVRAELELLMEREEEQRAEQG